MKALLDTHAFLWWITDDPRLSPRAREIIGDGNTELYLSAASGWEMAIKAGLGRLHLTDSLERIISEQLAANAIYSLPVQMSHALHVYTLPGHHRDPFDRILISQAILEHLPLLTIDPEIAKYTAEVLW
ncbi:MAG: type II toxin-antitoxin system VapC family toxin [Desulfobacterales bacterium]|nr:type II toxin-antitoxin system VapC family toxin [Desulfobacterales bacterium]